MDRDYNERLAGVFEKMEKKFVPRLKKHISPDLLKAHPSSRAEAAEPAESSKRTEPAESAKPSVSAKRARPAQPAQSSNSASVANHGWPFDVSSRLPGSAGQGSSPATGAEASASGQQAGQIPAESFQLGFVMQTQASKAATVCISLIQPPANT